MNADLTNALKSYNKIGWGGKLPDEDLDTLHEFLIKTVQESGIELADAVKIVFAVEGGNWSKGWGVGYDTAKNHYTPRFNLGS
jgi:hypothetical protein